MAQRPYHHGDLRRALLEAATEAIARSGPHGVTLREIARTVGVSHAAPAHHFGSRTGLLTAIAASGFAHLADATAEGRAAGTLPAAAASYVRFAQAHPGEFAVMFETSLLDWTDPALAETAARARRELSATITRFAGGAPDPEAAELAAWSLVHGLAALVRSGIVDAQGDAGALAERVARAIGISTGGNGDDSPAD